MRVRVRRALQDAGHDVAWVAELGPDPGDALVLARAYEDGRVLVTLDADYGALAVVEQRPHAGIIRLLVDEPQQQAAVCRHVMEHYAEDLAAGALVTAGQDKVRIRRTQPQ